MTIQILSYDELPSWVEKSGLSDNGAGKEWANYLVIEDGNYQFCESDTMEPEDARFSRDLSWIKETIEAARGRGYAEGYANGWLAGRNDA